MTAPRPDVTCRACGLPLVWMTTLYGAFWGTREGDLGPGECPETTGPWGLGYGPHSPSS